MGRGRSTEIDLLGVAVGFESFSDACFAVRCARGHDSDRWVADQELPVNGQYGLVLDPMHVSIVEYIHPMSLLAID